MNKNKLYFLAFLLVVTLHYLFVAGLSTRVSAWTSVTLCIATLCGAVMVWAASGFGERD